MEKKLYEGASNSGKTSSIKKYVRELIKNNKSMLILDTKKEYEELFKDSNYEIVKFDISDLDNTICYNPLFKAEELYKNKIIDEAISRIETFGSLLYKTEEAIDPYWDNAAKSMFIGICLYLLENNRNLNLKEIIKVSTSEMDNLTNYINEQDVLSTISIITSSIINVPKETKGGIISVLNQKLSSFAMRPNLLNKICTNDNINIKNKNQVIILTNFSSKTIFNMIVEVGIINIIKDMIISKDKYSVILDNFDSIMNTLEFNEIFTSYLSDNIECIVGVRDNGLIKPIDEFDVYFRKGKDVRNTSGEIIEETLYDNLREIDLNFDKLDKEVKFSDKALKEYSEEELEDIKKYIMKEKLLKKIDKKIEELDKEENKENI